MVKLLDVGKTVISRMTAEKVYQEALNWAKKHDEELTKMLFEIVFGLLPEADMEVRLTLSQCFMKDMSIQQNELEIREKIYANWIRSVVGRSFNDDRKFK